MPGHLHYFFACPLDASHGEGAQTTGKTTFNPQLQRELPHSNSLACRCQDLLQTRIMAGDCWRPKYILAGSRLAEDGAFESEDFSSVMQSHFQLKGVDCCCFCMCSSLQLVPSFLDVGRVRLALLSQHCPGLGALALALAESS